jgi:aspartyl-tRNA(Asn)/glutamyl-tRNA(Gln) amidotransferase subunit A
LTAFDQAAAAIGAVREIELPEVARARAAAYLITTSEGAALHLHRLRTRACDFDPDVRDRLIAGAMVPVPWVVQAQKFRRWFRDAMLKVFEEVDAILAPSTPFTAPPLGQKTVVLNGQQVPLRPNIGIYTQPISFVGLPVVAVPVPGKHGLPVGLQIITAPWREDVALRIAAEMERRGIVRAPRPPE